MTALPVGNSTSDVTVDPAANVLYTANYLDNPADYQTHIGNTYLTLGGDVGLLDRQVARRGNWSLESATSSKGETGRDEGLAAYWQRRPRSGSKTGFELLLCLVRDTGIEPVGAWAQPRALHGQINDFSSATKLSDRCANIGVSLGRLGSMDHYPRRKP